MKHVCCLTHTFHLAWSPDLFSVTRLEKQLGDFEAVMHTSKSHHAFNYTTVHDCSYNNVAGYHPYSDPDGFVYSVLLVRTFLLENRLEKFTLKVRSPSQLGSESAWTGCYPCPPPIYTFPPSAPLSMYPVVQYHDCNLTNPRPRVPIPRPWAQCLQLFESDALPATYACYVKYSRKGKSGRETLAFPGSTWDSAFAAFRKFFKTKTRKDWNDRLDGKSPPITNGNDEEPFHYEPPTSVREPKGLVMKKTRWERVKEASTGGDDSFTMVIPTIEISDDEEEGQVDVKACFRRGCNGD
jgi:WGR domain